MVYDKKKRGAYRNKIKGKSTKAELGYQPLNEFRTNILEARKHPALIFAQVGKDYIFFMLTHKQFTNGKLNVELCKNPNPQDPVSFDQFQNVNTGILFPMSKEAGD